jgi:diaminopimelate epimerase
MRVPFVKMQGLGNDFVVIDARALTEPLEGPQAIRWCDRHFGVGGDGLLLWRGSLQDPQMVVVNADGSVPEMCGNGLRCFAKFLGDRYLPAATALTVQTGAGPLSCALQRGADGLVERVAVEMGHASWRPEDVPLAQPEPLLQGTLVVDGVVLQLSALSTGNPHVVTFDAMDRETRLRLGPLLSHHPLFPRQANVEFVEVIADHGELRLVVDVFERGCGWTLACGTGATAAAHEAARQGRIPYDREVAVQLPGGLLGLTVRRDGSACMAGPAATVFEGHITLD